MKLTTAVLCDFAQVRDGLLFIASGGITRLTCEEFPAPTMVVLALMVEIDQVEMQSPHELSVHVRGEDGEGIATLTAGFHIGAGDLHVAENQQIPLTFDLRNMGIPAPGAYSMLVYIDSNHHHTLTFYATASEGSAANEGDN